MTLCGIRRGGIDGKVGGVGDPICRGEEDGGAVRIAVNGKVGAKRAILLTVDRYADAFLEILATVRDSLCRKSPER